VGTAAHSCGVEPRLLRVSQYAIPNFFVARKAGVCKKIKWRRCPRAASPILRVWLCFVWLLNAFIFLSQVTILAAASHGCFPASLDFPASCDLALQCKRGLAPAIDANASRAVSATTGLSTQLHHTCLGVLGGQVKAHLPVLYFQAV